MPTAAPARPTVDLGPALADRVAALWWQLTRQLPGELSRSAASVLAVLREDGPQRITALAERDSISQPAMSLLIQRLEARGLVVRGDDPADRRACRIAITPAGAAALSERALARGAWLEGRLAELSDAQRTAIAAALGALDALIAIEETA